MIPVNQPLLDGNEKRYLLECIETGWISSEGPFIELFEKSFAERIGRKHAIAVANGTVALDAAVEALGLGPGDEVIMPTFTIISCILQVVRSGATPILVDADPLTWNMDVNAVEKKITPRTKVIMVVHIYGLPVDMDPLLSLAKKYTLKVLEDAAEMHGQTYKKKPCGSFGDISTFSFYPNKLITTGEGGMIVTDSDELAQQCRDLRNLCFQSKNRFVHERLGWNMRMTNMQAAIGLAQLERLDEFIVIKRNMGSYYQELLGDINCIQLPIEKSSYAENIYWVFGIVLNEACKKSGAEVIKMLGSMGIGCRPFFYPMHQQPILKKMGYFGGGDIYPVSEMLYRYGFYIPSGLSLQKKDMESVAKCLHEVLKN
jgi:perosamine synthetase